MFFDTPEDSSARVTFGPALKHLVVFQLKLGADALRDLVMSPLSMAVFVLDAIRKPALEDSLYLRLMVLGRRSDAYINLFDQHKDKGHYTMDEAIETVARMAADAHQERQRED
ncbi:hypothetical protein DWB85_02075 [Seongchinamella sediminis]|uniref:Uncharacterized protein n=1 Tax=Seongchinamella sediminis TaxID=2283635 RepID=A0A3L7E489_9GAMM|nr:hypothetical protein [Seongchinamella sediminis]RLQ23363.1 hypothetical protein DWB85_02075 [Seongchinamella sediminis]